MRVLRTTLLGSIFAFVVAACGNGDMATVRLDFSPQAAAGGGTIVDSFPEANTQPPTCALPPEVTEIRAQVSAADLQTPLRFRMDTATEVTRTRDCRLELLVPAGRQRNLVVEAFDREQTLRRQGFSTLGRLDPGERRQAVVQMWPAKRVTEAADDGETTGPDLIATDIARTFEAFIVTGHFDAQPFPASRGGAGAILGLVEFCLACSPGQPRWFADLSTVDERGILFVRNDVLEDRRRIRFAFDHRRLTLRIPYDAFDGGARPPGTSPNASLRWLILDHRDALLDRMPNEEAAYLAAK